MRQTLFIQAQNLTYCCPEIRFFAFFNRKPTQHQHLHLSITLHTCTPAILFSFFQSNIFLHHCFVYSSVSQKNILSENLTKSILSYNYISFIKMMIKTEILYASAFILMVEKLDIFQWTSSLKQLTTLGFITWIPLIVLILLFQRENREKMCLRKGQHSERNKHSVSVALMVYHFSQDATRLK